MTDTDTDPIMSDHSDTSEEEANELRKIHQDNASDDGILGGIDNAAGSITRPLQGNDQDDGDIVDDAVMNDRAQRDR
jgi:hypothetical protein